MKNKFKKFGSNINIGYLPNIINQNHIEIGSNVIIGNQAILNAITFNLESKQNPNLTIGNNIYIGHNTAIHCMNDIVLEDNVVLSDYVYISDVSHGFEMITNSSIMAQPWVSKGGIIIGNGTFIGHGVKIMPNSKLGHNCIVAAGSIITKQFQDNLMLSGSPAIIIKRYCFEKKQWLKTDATGKFI